LSPCAATRGDNPSCMGTNQKTNSAQARHTTSERAMCMRGPTHLPPMCPRRSATIDPAIARAWNTTMPKRTANAMKRGMLDGGAAGSRPSSRLVTPSAIVPIRSLRKRSTEFCAFIMLHEMAHFVGFPGGAPIPGSGTRCTAWRGPRNWPAPRERYRNGSRFIRCTNTMLRPVTSQPTQSPSNTAFTGRCLIRHLRGK
jgi:hypothetical protein